ncbi:hypothetical protein SJS76_06050 [Aeromonas caviae]|uniref:hypothetical protein n=1 Tax=Aeromonas caviae TaxID=648 RepID=UPI0029D6C6B0|nr:hypothetical protein [Aeromonas caviae]MDX7839107.1 hypothetical protein [Aeromonas caviae]
MFLSRTEGEYLPSSFMIKIKTYDDISNLKYEMTSTFIHEYIHFLQDLTLPYCVRENLVHLSTFFDRLDVAKRDNKINIPQIISIDGLELTTLQTEMTWGSLHQIKNAPEIICITQNSKPIPEHEFTLHSYELNFSNGDKYHFGARDILEYIAYKIEKKHFPDEDELADFPYNSVDLVINHYDLDSLSDIKRMALAEYCLINDNPANMLINILKSFLDDSSVDSKLLALNDQDFIVKLGMRNYLAAGRPFETIKQKLKRRHYELSCLLQQRYPQHTFPDIHEWLVKTIEYVESELSGIFIFTHLYGSTTDNFNRRMQEIISSIGIPIVMNSQGQIASYLSDEYKKEPFIQLLLAYDFTSYLEQSDPQCPLCSNCELEPIDIMTDDCINAPFRRAHQEVLCPFGKFLKSHDIHDLQWYAEGRLIVSTSSPW